MNKTTIREWAILFLGFLIEKIILVIGEKIWDGYQWMEERKNSRKISL